MAPQCKTNSAPTVHALKLLLAVHPEHAGPVIVCSLLGHTLHADESLKLSLKECSQTAMFGMRLQETKETLPDALHSNLNVGIHMRKSHV